MPHAAFNTYLFWIISQTAKCDGIAFQSTDMQATCIVNWQLHSINQEAISAKY